MATKKTTAKKASSSAKCCTEDKMQEVKKVADELMAKMKEAKKKFNQMDQATRKKIIAGAAGVVALLAGIKMARGMKKKKKK